MTHITEPLACSLKTPDAARQALEWADLRRNSIAVERLENGVVMTFRLDRAEDVEDLAAREAECCRFLSIATSRTEHAIRLEITSGQPEANAVIEALAGIGAR